MRAQKIKITVLQGSLAQGVEAQLQVGGALSRRGVQRKVQGVAGGPGDKGSEGELKQWFDLHCRNGWLDVAKLLHEFDHL